MKTLGREVLFLRTDLPITRIGESAFALLRDGSILFVCSAFTGGIDDNGDAYIAAYRSRDGGESWEGPRALVRKQPGDLNVMSVSMLRMANGDLGLFYGRKQSEQLGRLWLRRSSDEGESWSEPVLCMPREGYFVTNNDRVVRLRSGRIVVPGNEHGFHPDGGFDFRGHARFFCSDDDGRSWFECGEGTEFPASNDPNGLQESGLLELTDGRVWSWARTDAGCQYESFSSDGCAHWTTPRPNPFFSSPLSPMQAIRLPDGRIVAAFNPIPNYTTRDIAGTWGRSPLLLAISEDDARSFHSVGWLEDDLNDGYCYPALCWTGDALLAAYYHSAGTGNCLCCTRIRKIRADELK